MMSTLFAGPFVGEFGWELFGWQARVRRIAKKFDKVIVSARPGRGVLYKDFATEFVAYEAGCVNTSEHFAKGFRYNGIHRAYLTGADKGRFIRPNKRLVDYKPGRPLLPTFINQDFIPYGTKGATEPFDVVIHVRTRVGWGTTERNWAPKKWARLVQRLRDQDVTVAAIGSKGESAPVPGAEDRRGLRLTDTMDLLASAGTAIGPSSGPLHLASLCRCPQVVWSPIHNKVRYEKDWNPFNTRVSFLLAKDWQPSVENVYRRVMEMLNG